MSTRMYTIAVAAFSAFAASNAAAQVDLAVDMDPSTPGVQDSIAAAPGTSLTVDLVVVAPAAGLAGYEFSASFDSGELTAPSPSEGLPSGFTLNFTPGVRSIGPASVEGFEAISLPGPGPVGASFVAGSIVFTVGTPVTDAIPDVVPELLGTDGGFGDNAFDKIPIGNIAPGFVDSAGDPLDFNGDGSVDIADLVGFLNEFFGAQADPALDFNGDGSVDIADLIEFINAFFASP